MKVLRRGEGGGRKGDGGGGKGKGGGEGGGSLIVFPEKELEGMKEGDKRVKRGKKEGIEGSEVRNST